jgi:hypothetical protein
MSKRGMKEEGRLYRVVCCRTWYNVTKVDDIGTRGVFNDALFPYPKSLKLLDWVSPV